MARPSADQIAALDDVAEFAKGLSDAKLLCRMNRRHIQDPNRTNVVPPTRYDRRYSMEGPCVICGQTVKRTFDEFFGRVRTSLAVDYDDDYLMPRGSGRIDANGSKVLVQEFMERAGAVPKKRARKSVAKVTPITAAKGA